MRRFPRRAATAVALALALGGASLIGTGVASAQQGTSGYAPIQETNINRPVPSGASLLPNGRLVSPAGSAYFQGNFPLAMAISPDGTTAVATGVGQGDGTAEGNFEAKCVDGLGAGSCGYGPIGQSNPPAQTPDEGLFVTNLATGAVTALRGPLTQCKPGNTTETLSCFEAGVAFSPDGHHVYASGGGNDAVYDFTVTPPAAGSPAGSGDTVTGPARVTYLQELNGAPASSSTYQSPSTGTTAARTKGLAVSADGAYLFVVKEQAGALDILRTSDLSLVQEVPLGVLDPAGSAGSVTYPYTVVVAPDTSAAYVTLQGTGIVLTVPLLTNPVTGALSAGGAVPTLVGAAPTGEALSPDGSTLMVADANDDTVKVISNTTHSVTQSLTVRAIASSPNGSVPNAVTFASATRAYVALAGDDAVAQIDLAKGTWSVSGLIPTGWYPTAVGVRPGGDVVTLAAKGVGESFPLIGGYSKPPVAGGPQALDPGYYDASAMPGLVTETPQPSSADLASDTALVQRDITFADTEQAAPANSPIPSTPGGATPITHVVYIVRENRTYDQEYGDLAYSRNDSDSDPAFESLASATPNGHAVVGRYASSDSFFSDGEASVQGHWWTSSANTDDYVEKSWEQYYSDRSHFQDSILAPTSSPANCSIFQSALAKQTSTAGAFSWKDYGEPVGAFDPSFTGQIPIFASAGTTPNTCAAVPAASIDPTPFASFEGIDDRNFVDSSFHSTVFPTGDPGAFLQDSGLNPDGTAYNGGLGTSGVGLRSFNYLELPGDHTTGFTKQGTSNLEGHTPRAEIAENDAAVGEVISALSKSKYWSSTAVFVVEDDSQDGPDHVDGHRNVLLVASPYAKQTSANGCYGGYISHVHYDQASVLRTIEDILGLPALSSFDANAEPLYDLFQAKSDPSQLTASDLAPFTQPSPAPFVDEVVGQASAGSAALQTALEHESAHLDLHGPDLAGPVLEDVLWHSTSSKAVPTELSERVSSWEVAHNSGASDAAAAKAADQAEGTGAGLAYLTSAPTPAATSCAPTDVRGGPNPNVPETGKPVVFGAVGVLLVIAGGGIFGGRRRRLAARP